MSLAPSHARPRRLLTATVGTFAALSLLAGCASGTATAEPAGTGASAATEMIDFAYEGYAAQIPADPQRVVVLDSRSALEFALMADYPLVATAYGTDSPLSALVDDGVAHLKNTAFDLNREEIASYEPDLIVVGDGWYNYYEGEDFKLADIAPVLAVNSSFEVPGASIDNPFAAMTDQLELLDRADKAQAAIDTYDAAVASAQEKIGDVVAGKSITVLHLPEENFTVISNEEIYQIVLPQLGFTILDNEAIQAGQDHPNGAGGKVLSYENAINALGDADVVMLFQGVPGADLDPLLQRVPAVEAGHVIEGNLAERVGFALTYAAFVERIVEAVEGF